MTNFVQQFDAEPQSWQFLRGLRSEDLLIELIQNELDANASRTCVAFQPGRLICQGDGDPVDDAGWKRLAYVMGAGDQVESKHFRIGVKNHGLKACFKIGDEIILRSAGRRMIQTLYKDGPQQAPSPGTFPEPVLDEEAPPIGCSVEVPYRTKQLVVSKGESFELAPIDNSFVERLFWDAYKYLPKRLLGIVRPGPRDRYTLRLSHHELGAIELHWQAKRGRVINGKRGRRFTLFSRECKVSSDIPELPPVTIREQGCIFRGPSSLGSGQEIPDFFKPARGSFLAEIAWLTGKPKAVKGARRYPIEYETTSEAALTGVGVHFSGPYSSDAERHGASQSAPLNGCIDNACKDALVEIMAAYLLPRYGGGTMALYIANPPGLDDAPLKDLVERTLAKRALPLRNAQRRPSMRAKATAPKVHGTSSFPVALGPRRRSRGSMRRIVLPMLEWDQEQVSKRLSEICPNAEDQIDPAIPAPILSLLACHRSADLTTFDQNDVIERLQPQIQTKYFPWETEAEWKESLGNPSIAKKYMDVTYETIQYDGVNAEQGVVQNTYLPDANSTARPLSKMYRAVNLPPNLGGEDYAPILHPDIRNHPLLKRQAWKRPTFTLDNYLDRASLETASPENRRSFWRWLRNNWKSVKPQTRHRIADVPVWPCADGCLLPLDDLCKPRAARVASLMGSVLHRPSSDLLRVRLPNKNSRGRQSVRSIPTTEELSRFLSARLQGIPSERPLTPKERREFHKFESDIAFLAATPQLRKSLAELSSTYGVALAQDGRLKTPGKLVRSEGLPDLHLPARHIIDRPKKELDRIQGWAPAPSPTSAQIVDALIEDGARLNAHVPRLQAYIKQARHEDIAHDGLRDTPCIPFNGKLHSPGQLALHGKRNFWGEWKTIMPVLGINAEVQQLYRDVGVVGGEPNSINSRGFFRWLAPQNPRAIARHIDQVLRHIGHKLGPLMWGTEYPTIPFIPVECDGEGVRLVTKAGAARNMSKVVIPDFGPLEEQIRRRGGKRPVDLAIVESSKVMAPITTELRELGLRTLSDFAGEPISVVGKGRETSTSYVDFKGILDSLRSGVKGQELRKRLDSLDIDSRQNSLKTHWRDSLLHIQNVKTADSVSATYRLSRNTYSVTVAGKLDESSQTLWLRYDSAQRENFFDIIAEHIFQKPQKYLGPVLDRACRMAKMERNPDVYMEGSDPPEDLEVEEALGQSGEIGGLAATSGTHSAPEPAPARNIPRPGPIPTGSGIITGGRKANRSQLSRTQVATEEAQIENLKEKQYAWHCQACLSMKDPLALAPPASYVALHQNRRSVMQAHHCDQVNAEGARHAGNLLLLCQYHHLEFGDAVSRSEVVQCLRKPQDRSLTFSSDGGLPSTVQGKIVTIHPPQRQTPVSLFFTREHADYWLTKASEEGVI